MALTQTRITLIAHMLPQKDLFKTITLFQVEPVSVRGAWVVCDSIGLLADKLAFPNSLKKKKKIKSRESMYPMQGA